MEGLAEQLRNPSGENEEQEKCGVSWLILTALES